MPRRDDIDKVLLIGSGPIVIGQACEFDYSGTQACKALRQEGYRVVLVNSNPATIMTDPETAHRTYVEPITADVLERIITADGAGIIVKHIGDAIMAVFAEPSAAVERALQIHEGLDELNRAHPELDPLAGERAVQELEAGEVGLPVLGNPQPGSRGGHGAGRHTRPSPTRPWAR